MKTAEQMVQYCIDNKYIKGTTTLDKMKKMFLLIEQNLGKDESVTMCFAGTFKRNNSHDNVCVVTNKRIILLEKIIFDQEFQTINFENINDITVNFGILISTIKINTLKEIFELWVSPKIAQAFNDIVYDILSLAKQNNSTGSVADEILKFKNLLDMGIITQEEFDTKKAQLLQQ